MELHARDISLSAAAVFISTLSLGLAAMYECLEHPETAVSQKANGAFTVSQLAGWLTSAILFHHVLTGSAIDKHEYAQYLETEMQPFNDYIPVLEDGADTFAAEL